MDKSILVTYRSRKARIKKLQEDIKDLSERNVEVVAGKVQTSMSEHPYIQCRTSVQMDDPVERDKIDTQISKKQREIDQLEQINKKVEDFIDSIQDATAKSIFEYYYTDGSEKITQKEIADKVGMNNKKISAIITQFLTA